MLRDWFVGIFITVSLLPRAHPELFEAHPFDINKPEKEKCFGFSLVLILFWA